MRAARSLLLFFLASLFLAAVLGLVSQTRADPDLWGHLRFGRDIIVSGTVARTPSYSFTADRPWVNHEWLAEVIMASAYRAGSAGLLALSATVAVATFLALAVIILGAGVRGPAAAGLLAAAMLGASLQLMTVRPQLFSVLLLAVLLLILTRSPRRPALLVATPALFALWANLHGGWIVGMGVLGLWVAVAVARGSLSTWRAAAVLASAVLGSLCTPYGFGLWTFLAETVRVGRADIEEWEAIWEKPAQFLPWAVSLLMLGYGCVRLRRDWWLTLPAIALALLSVRVARLEGLFALTAVALAAAGYKGVGRPFQVADRPAPGEILLVVALGLAGLGGAAFAASRTATCVPLMTDREMGTPEPEAVRFLSQNQLRGNLLTWFDYGEYAIWHLAPRLQVSYDGRRETAYSERVQEDHAGFYRGDATYARRVKADYIWIPRSLPVVEPLLAQGWVAVFAGPRSVVLARQPGQYSQPAAFSGPRCFPGP